MLPLCEGTKKFESVTLDVSARPEGLRLSFILEPAYYIGIIEFPEAAKTLQLYPVTSGQPIFPTKNPTTKRGFRKPKPACGVCSKPKVTFWLRSTPKFGSMILISSPTSPFTLHSVNGLASGI